MLSFVFIEYTHGNNRGLGNRGPISLTGFRPYFNFDGNFVLLSRRFYISDRYKILYTTQNFVFSTDAQ